MRFLEILVLSTPTILMRTRPTFRSAIVVLILLVKMIFPGSPFLLHTILSTNMTLCETSLSRNEIVPDDIVPDYNYHGSTIRVVRKRVVFVLFYNLL